MSEAARRILLAIFQIGAAGLLVELVLLGHTEGAFQLIPLALAAIGMAALLAAACTRRRPALRLVQLVAAGLILSGFAGVYLHFRANLEFQLEVDPSLEGLALLAKAIRAKTPPALAPGAMIQLGLIALAYTFRHPSIGRSLPE